MKTLLFISIVIAYSTLYSKTIYVPKDYVLIQVAIDSAHYSDTIRISNGNYPTTSLTITKSLTVVGESSIKTILSDANPYVGIPLLIVHNAEHVVLQNISFLAHSPYMSSTNSTIMIDSSKYVNFINVSISGLSVPTFNNYSPAVKIMLSDTILFNSTIIQGGSGGEKPPFHTIDGGAVGLSLTTIKYCKIENSEIYGGDGNPRGLALVGNNSSFISASNSKLMGGYSVDSSSKIILNNVLSIKNTGSITPSIINLKQNYPNPFNSATIIEYSLPEETSVTITLYDLAGREIEILDSGHKLSGNHKIQFDARYLSSGMYYYQLRTNNYQTTHSMILLK